MRFFVGLVALGFLGLSLYRIFSLGPKIMGFGAFSCALILVVTTPLALWSLFGRDSEDRPGFRMYALSFGVFVPSLAVSYFLTRSLETGTSLSIAFGGLILQASNYVFKMGKSWNDKINKRS